MPHASYAFEDLEGFGPITWGLSVGVSPYVTSIEVSVALADKIVEGGILIDGRAPLWIGGDPGDEFEHIYLVRVEPVEKYTSRLILADRRWLWPRDHIEMGFNVRRRIGDVFMFGDQPENAELVDKFKYEQWSTNESGAPWTYQEVLEKVLARAPGGVRGFDPGAPVGERFGPLAARLITDPASLAKVPVDGLWLIGSYAECLAKVLSLHGGLSLWIDKLGGIVVADKISTEARAIEDLPGPVAVGGGWIGKADRRFERPKAVLVYFDVEQELRFDYEEPATLKTKADDAKNPELDLDNVIPTTDIEFGRGRGNWLEISEFFNSLPELDQYREPFIASAVLDLPTLRKYYLKQYALDDLLIGTKASFEGVSGKDAFWERVVRVVNQHYRRTFRLNQFWRDRVRQMKAYRVTNIDVASGTRGNAQAFMDYTIAFSGRFLYLRSQAQTGAPQACVNGYAEKLDDAIPAPAMVSVIDAESGVLRVDLLTDTSGDRSYLIPGKIDKPFTIRPNADGLGTFVSTLAKCGVKSEFKMAVVLTCTLNPGNDGRQRLAGVVERHRDFTSEPALGRAIDVKIAATPHMIARMAWSDEEGEDIRDSCVNGRGVSVRAHDLCLNKKELLEISRAVAKSIYEMFDCSQTGSATIPATPGNMTSPFGSTSAVTLTINPDGSAFYNLSSALSSYPVRWQTKIPTSTKRADAGLVLP